MNMIDPKHRKTIEHLAANSPSAPVRRRATLLLLYHAGHATNEVAQKAGLSVSSVLRWRRLYREQGMGIFPAAARQRVPAKPAPKPAAKPEKEASSQAEKAEAPEKTNPKENKPKMKKAKKDKAKKGKGKKDKAKKGKGKKDKTKKGKGKKDKAKKSKAPKKGKAKKKAGKKAKK